MVIRDVVASFVFLAGNRARGQNNEVTPTYVPLGSHEAAYHPLTKWDEINSDQSYCRVSLPINSAKSGNLLVRSVRVPNSKSSKENPGATVHPTKENEFSSITSAANQCPADTTT